MWSILDMNYSNTCWTRGQFVFTISARWWTCLTFNGKVLWKQIEKCKTPFWVTAVREARDGPQKKTRQNLCSRLSANTRAVKSVCMSVHTQSLWLQKLIPVVWTDFECFKKITDCRQQRQISWQLSLQRWMDGQSRSFTAALRGCVCVCEPVCIQEGSMTAGNNSSVNFRCLKLYKCVCVNIDLPGTYTQAHAPNGL